MRIAFTGVSHWHTDFYVRPVERSSGTEIVGVSDPSEAAASRWRQRLGTESFASYQEMCERTRPDFVFALGRHADMAATAGYLIESGIPFAMEKPCGVTLAQIARIRDEAAARNSFAAVPFFYRYSDLRNLISELADGEELRYGMFRLVPGTAARYRDWGTGWHLDRGLSGGGCTLNLSIHFFDLVRVLAPTASWTVAAASMSSAMSGVEVEDYSVALLEADGRRAVVETAYATVCAGGETAISVYTDSRHFKLDAATGSVIVAAAGAEDQVFRGGSQADHYAAFVADTMDRVSAGRPPAAGLADMFEAARLAESAYRRAGDQVSMTGDFSVGA